MTKIVFGNGRQIYVGMTVSLSWLNKLCDMVSRSINSISLQFYSKLQLRNFQDYKASSFDFSILYTLLPHDLIKAKVLSLVNWCFKESQKRTSVLQKKQTFIATRSMTRLNVGLALSYICEAFTFLVENIYVQFEEEKGSLKDHGLSTNSGDSYGHKLCSTHSGLVFNLLYI